MLDKMAGKYGFSLLICPNDGVRYGGFLSGIGRHFKRSVVREAYHGTKSKSNSLYV